jgi:hypothetical protein
MMEDGCAWKNPTAHSGKEDPVQRLFEEKKCHPDMSTARNLDNFCYMFKDKKTFERIMYKAPLSKSIFFMVPSQKKGIGYVRKHWWGV